MNKPKHVAQGLLAICTPLLFIHLGSHPVQASEASVYKETIADLVNETIDDDGEPFFFDNAQYFHVKFRKKTNDLYIKLKFPDRDTIYYSSEHWGEAIRAAKKAPLKHTTTVTIKDELDKYTFNLSDIQALNFKKKFIRQWMQDNQPGEYHEENGDFNYELYCYNYVEEVLFPKAINHVDYYNKD